MDDKRSNRQNAKSTESQRSRESSNSHSHNSRRTDPRVTAAKIALAGVIVAALIMALAPLLAPLIGPILERTRGPTPNDPCAGAKRHGPSVKVPPPVPKGFVIFDADEWREQSTGGKKEIVRAPGTELNVGLRKVGVGISDLGVERQLVYSKSQEDALEIQYEFASGTEIGVHFVLHYLRPGFSDCVRLDQYEKGDVFLRIKPIPIDDDSDANDVPPVSFGLKLEHGSTSFWDEVPHSSAEGKLHESSGWRDIRIPIKPYVDRMKQAASTEADGARLDGLVVYFTDRYSSPRRGRLWLNAIVLTNEVEGQSQID